MAIELTNDGLLIIISGPSGSGKGTITKNLRNKEGYALSISMTTREQRKGEVNGEDYIFCNEDEFIKTRDSGGFLEHATFCGNYYGTPISYVRGKMEQMQTVVLEIDVVGALQVKEKFPTAPLIFLMPPTLEELRKRLISRGREDLDEIRRRLNHALKEIDMMDKYDYLIINEDIETACKEIGLIVAAERLRPIRSKGRIEGFFGDLEGEEHVKAII